MAYKTADLLKKAISVTKTKKLFFIEDIICYLPCSKQTFYDHKLDESDKLKELLAANKTTEKLKLRKKWGETSNATLQLALYKLLCTPEERRNIAMNYNEHTGKDGSSLFGEIDDETAKKIADKIAAANA